MEYIKNYIFPIKYHVGKANVVVDLLRRKTSVSGCTIAECYKWDNMKKETVGCVSRCYVSK